jgi:hypothetical protein
VCVCVCVILAFCKYIHLVYLAVSNHSDDASCNSRNILPGTQFFDLAHSSNVYGEHVQVYIYTTYTRAYIYMQVVWCTYIYSS